MVAVAKNQFRFSIPIPIPIPGISIPIPFSIPLISIPIPIPIPELELELSCNSNSGIELTPTLFTGITYRSDDGYVCHNYTLYTTKLLGGILVSHISCRLCNAYSSGWIHFIFISSNFRRCVTCKVYCKVSKFEFLAIFLILYLWLCLVLTGDLMWITSIGNHGATGVGWGGGGGGSQNKGVLSWLR